MVPRNPVRNKNKSGAIEFSLPPPAASPGSELHRLIHLGVRKRFVPAFIPAPPAENTHPGIQWLFEIDAKSVFERSTEWMSGDVWLGCQTCHEMIDCFTVAPHVGVIDEGQKPDNALLMTHHRPMQFKLEVFGVRAAQVRVEMDPIGNFWHQRHGESRGPSPVVVFDHRRKSEAACIRCVVVRAVVVHGPVHELKTRIRTIRIHVEEVRHAELPEANLQPALRK